MTPTEKGSFCASCKKEVIDFTQTSNYKLAKKLDRKEAVCGRFRPDQLNRQIRVAQNNPMYRASMVMGFTSIFAVATPVVAQVDHTSTEIIDQPFVMGRIDIAQGLSDVIIIKGFVQDAQALPLPGAYIVLKGSKIGVQTDFDGKFHLELSKKDFQDNSVLIVSYIGYEPQEINVYEKTEFLSVELTEDYTILGEVVIIRKQNFFEKVGNLFKKKENRICKNEK